MSQLLKSEPPGHSESKSHLLYVDVDKQVYTHVGHKTSSVSLMKSFSVFRYSLSGRFLILKIVMRIF